MTISSAVNNASLDGYLKLLNSLNAESKSALIARLEQAEQTAPVADATAFQRAFGAWVSDQSAEEIITDLRAARTFNRQIEAF